MCKQVRYCGLQCEQVHWDAQHKDDCKRWAARVPGLGDDELRALNDSGRAEHAIRQGLALQREEEATRLALRETVRREIEAELRDTKTQVRMTHVEQQGRLEGQLEEQRGRLTVQLFVATVKLQESNSSLKVLQQENLTAHTLAAVPMAARVPGLDDEELRALDDSVRAELASRRQLALQREEEATRRVAECQMRETVRREMRAEMEREREARDEERQCEICMAADKDTALACGHRACALCHVCRAPIGALDRRRIY
jgi:hypothetical protein